MRVAAPAGLGVTALPALRVTGPYLAMVTLAFGAIMQILINEGHPLPWSDRVAGPELARRGREIHFIGAHV